jgi:hypothetical protein
MRSLISTAERVLPEREFSAPAYQNLRDTVNTRSFLGEMPDQSGLLWTLLADAGPSCQQHI